MSHQNTVEHLRELMRQGMSCDEANVELVRSERVRLIRNKIPKQIRKALNSAVRIGKLRHMPKDGHKPEAYYHPEFEYLASGKRAEVRDEVLQALSRYAGFSSGDKA